MSTAVHIVVGVIGVAAVVAAMADMVNTLVTTHTSLGRFWMTTILYLRAWKLMRFIATKVADPRRRERLLSTFAPVSVLGMLVAWIVQLIVGWSMLWWALGGIEGATTPFHYLYYSGVVFFTLGFGEILPIASPARIAVLGEAFTGVLTTALVVGYLPSLYGAYSERERKLITLDDGTEHRVTPVNLLIARCHNGGPEALNDYFAGWEEWIAHVSETHTAFPMLSFFRSKQYDQHWITALGLVMDAALLCEFIEGAAGQNNYWTVRRGVRLLNQLTTGADLTEYRNAALEAVSGRRLTGLQGVYTQLEAAGIATLPFEQAVDRTQELRLSYGPALEYLIDVMLCPRGFWPHRIGLPQVLPGQLLPDE